MHRRLVEALNRADVDSPEPEAWSMLEAVSGRERIDLMLAPSIEWSDAMFDRLDAWVSSRAEGVPLQHILGVATFYGLDLHCDARALIPRPETEVLVERALDDLVHVRRPVLVDVGTGSGAIAVAIAHARPDAEVWACDVDLRALSLAEENVARHGVRVRLVHSDLLTATELAPIVANADVVVANLPYLPEADADAVAREVRHDPVTALYAGRDGLDLVRRLVVDLASRLPRRAVAWFEVDPRNVDAAADFCRARMRCSEGRCTVHEDLVGRRRFVRWAPGGDDAHRAHSDARPSSDDAVR